MFYRAKHQPGDVFLYGIFGVQYEGESPNSRAQDLIKQFDGLIAGRAHHDKISHPGKNGHGTQMWLSYWREDKFKEWWSSQPVSTFWAGLDDNAGVWREILTVHTGRTQNACTAKLTNGINGLDVMEPFSEKIGYWGCLRDRLPDTTAQERFPSPLASISQRATIDGRIRQGRTVITQVPDNICFLVEGQDHSRMSAEEKAHWFANFDELVSGWMHHLEAKADDNGLLDIRMGYVPENGTFRDIGPINLDHNRKIEIFFWLDMAKFERAGRVHHGHIKLRRRWMEDYGPGGPMGPGIGNITLWEETSILKRQDVQAEYIGCREGTGFMGYDTSGFVQSETTTKQL